MKREGIKIIVCIVVVCSLAIINFAYAQNNDSGGSDISYTLLQPLPGVGSTGVKLSDYIDKLYRLALGFAAFAAVLMIVIGGLQIVIGGASETQRSEGRKRIESALWGLILALSAVLILNIINPNLTKRGFQLKEISVDLPPKGEDWSGPNPCESVTTNCVPENDPCYGAQTSRGQLRKCETKTQCENEGFTWKGCVGPLHKEDECGAVKKCVPTGDPCRGKRNDSQALIVECENKTQCENANREYTWMGCVR